MLVDTHAHLEAIDDLEDSLKRAKEAGVRKIITIGSSLDSSKKAIGIAQKYSSDELQIFATCGLHPKDAKGEIKGLHYNDILKSLKSLALSSKKIVAIGECGLDYYPDTTDEEKEFQRELFEKQIKLASDLNLPLVIHCRNAWDDLISLLTTDYRLPTPQGVFHSWTGDWKAAEKAINLDFYISFSGIVTFKNAKEIQEAAKKMPLGRMLIETDSPFLSPEPLRGKRNEPKNVRIVAQFLAHLRNQPIDRIIGASADNAKRLFGI